jgi:hypothetical protein
MIHGPGESQSIARMKYPITFNNISNFTNEVHLSSGITYNPAYPFDMSFFLECKAPFDEQTAHHPPHSPSLLPTLESLDAAFEIDIGGEIPSARFSLSELTRIVLSVLNKDFLSDIQVLAYGYCNKVYSLTFSDGTGAVVRLPHVDGEARGEAWLRRLLECEVATMKYAKQNLAPEFAALIPTIYTWDADPNNVVGQQYVVMEKMEGVRFSDAWDDATIAQKRYVAEQFARFTYALYSIGNEFTKFGSIYLDSQSGGFYVGPYVNRDYEVKGGSPGIDEGPWTKSSEFFLEQLKSRQLAFSSAQNSDDDDSFSSIIEHLQNLRPFASDFDASIIDGVQRITTHRSLFHSDLHAKNFLIDPTTIRLTGILDWEGMGIFPDWISMSIPKFLEMDKFSKIWDSKDSYEIPRELESLREWYLFERDCLQPGYSNQIEAHLKLYKLYNAIFIEPEDLEDNTNFKWIEEELWIC